MSSPSPTMSLLTALLADDFPSFHHHLITYGLPSWPTDYHLLAKALLIGRTDMARLLVEFGCTLDLPHFRGNSPLHLAVHNDDSSELVEQMLIRGSVVSRLDPRGDTALHVAFDNDADKRIVDMLLLDHLSRSVSNETNEVGLTYLHVAASRPNLDFVRCLVEHGDADVDCQVRADVDLAYAGYSPLHVAVEYGRLEVAEALLDYGANLYAKNANGSTSLHLALERRDVNMIELLFEYDEERVNHVNRFGLSHFMVACACRNPYVAWDFIGNLSNVVNINEMVNGSPFYSFNGYTALLMAVEYGRLETVRLLLANGAETRIRTCQGLELRRVAVKNEHYDVARLIELHMQNYEVVDRDAQREFTDGYSSFRMDWSS